MLYEIISPDAFLRPFIDDYATLCRAIRLKQEAGIDIAVELAEVRQTLEAESS